MDDLKEEGSDDDEDEEGEEPWSHRHFVFTSFQGFRHVASLKNVGGVLLVRHPHTLLRSHFVAVVVVVVDVVVVVVVVNVVVVFYHRELNNLGSVE